MISMAFTLISNRSGAEQAAFGAGSDSKKAPAYLAFPAVCLDDVPQR
jgi:hypothetical protein